MKKSDLVVGRTYTNGRGRKRKLLEMMNSSLLHAFTREDYYDVLAVLRRVVDRLEEQNG